MWIEKRSKDTPTTLFFTKIMNLFNLPTRRSLGVFLNIPESKISRYINGVTKPGYDRCLQIQAILRKHGMEIDVYDIRPRT